MCSSVVTFLPNLQNILPSIPRFARRVGGEGRRREKRRGGGGVGRGEGGWGFCPSVLLEIVSLGCWTREAAVSPWPSPSFILIYFDQPVIKSYWFYLLNISQVSPHGFICCTLQYWFMLKTLAWFTLISTTTQNYCCIVGKKVLDCCKISWLVVTWWPKNQCARMKQAQEHLSGVVIIYIECKLF